MSSTTQEVTPSSSSPTGLEEKVRALSVNENKDETINEVEDKEEVKSNQEIVSPKTSSPSSPSQKQENPPSKVVHLRNLPLPASNHHFQNPGSHYNQANANVENEIIEAAFKYGHVMDILLMRKSGQAFLQMESMDAGRKFVEAHREKPLNIGTHSVYVQFSKHSELTNIDDNQHQQKIRKTLEDARNGVFRDFRTNYNTNNTKYNKTGNNNSATSHRSTSSNNWAQENDTHDNRAGGDNNVSASNERNNNSNSQNLEKRILHVVIEKEDTQNPVKIHDYYDTFSKHGNVQKIVMFKKTGPTNTQQVLIEMDTQIACATAYSQFNGKNLRGNNQKNPHTMRIDYSTLSELTVKADGETRWDYTRSKRPNGDEMNSHHHNGFHNHMMGGHHPHMMANNMVMGPNGPMGPLHGNFMAPQFLNNQVQQNTVFGNNNLGNNNSNNRAGSANSNSQTSNNNNTSTNSKLGNSINAQPWIPNNNNNSANSNSGNSGSNSQAGGDNKMNQLPHMFNNFQPVGGPNGFQSYIHPMMMSNLVNNHPNLQHMQYAYATYDPSKMPQMPFQAPGQLPQNQFDPRQMNMMMQQMPYIQNNVGSCVVCVSNLNTEQVKPDDLFTLFGTHGDVVRVKILYEKRDTALIEFQLQMQAEQALRNLNNKKLFGKEMKLKLSKFPKVNMPKEGADTYNLTKEYLNSPLHRYRKTGSKNYQNIYEPSNVLHLSNIPDGKSEDDIVSIFSKYAPVQKFKFFKDTKMALIQVNSIDDAIHCLIKTHNHRMSANQHLRVSFSKGFLS